MKYIFFTFNVVFDASGHFLVFLIWRYFFGLDNLYLQLAVAFILLMNLLGTILSPVLIHWRDNALSRSVYLLFFGLWSGFVLNTVLTAAVFFLGAYLGIFSASVWTPLAKSLFIGLVPLLMLLPEAWLAQATKVKTRTVRIKDLPEAWIGREVVHISDIHLGPIWRQRFFDKLIRKIETLQAAAIFITGDLFDGMEADFSWFKHRKFFAPLGVFYVFGNHDLILGTDKVRSLLTESNIEILDKSMKEESGLQILCLTFYYEGRLDVKGKILAQVGYNPQRPSILMYHEPKDIEAARTAGIDLQLSGHTHGGQMFPFNLLAKILFKGFSSGFHHLRGFTISISAGVGTWGPPLRLGSRSEIVVLKLLKA